MIIFIALQASNPYMPYYSIGCMLGTCLLHTFVLEDEKNDRREQLESILKVEEIQEMELGKTRKMAFSDPLTGVKNKMAYLEDVGSFEQKIEDGFLHDFGLVVFDLNEHKFSVDTHALLKGLDLDYIDLLVELLLNLFNSALISRRHNSHTRYTLVCGLTHNKGFNIEISSFI